LHKGKTMANHEAKRKVAQEPGTTLTAPATPKAPVERSAETSAAVERGAKYAMEFAREDVAIPFLRVVQSNSHECTVGDPKYNDLARPGMFIDSVSGELMDGGKGVVVIPVAYQRSYVEWKPRATGGGLVKDFGADPSRLKDCHRAPNSYKDLTPEGNELVLSGLYYVLVVNEATGDYGAKLLVLQGTQLKKSRAWNTLMASLRFTSAEGEKYAPAPFEQSWRFTTVPEKNDKGAWMGVKIAPAARTADLDDGDTILNQCAEFFDLVRAGKVKTSPVEAPDADIIEAEIVDNKAPADGGKEF